MLKEDKGCRLENNHGVRIFEMVWSGKISLRTTVKQCSWERKPLEKGPEMDIREGCVKGRKASMVRAWREPNHAEALSHWKELALV